MYLDTASWAYMQKDAPRYVPGTVLNIVCTGATPVVVLVTMLYIRRENKIREAGGRDHRLDGLTKAEMLDLGSRHPRCVDFSVKLDSALMHFQAFVIWSRLMNIDNWNGG
jgi:hypothetical protein